MSRSSRGLYSLLLALYLLVGAVALFQTQWAIPGILGQKIQDAGHSPYFFGLTCLIYYAAASFKKPLPFGLLISVVFAAAFLSELGQVFFNRTLSFKDVLANLSGVLAALGCIALSKLYLTHIVQPHPQGPSRIGADQKNPYNPDRLHLLPPLLIFTLVLAALCAYSFRTPISLLQWQYAQTKAPIIYDFSAYPTGALAELNADSPYIALHRSATATVSHGSSPKSCAAANLNSPAKGQAQAPAGYIMMQASDHEDWSGLRLQDLHAHAFLAGKNSNSTLFAWLKQRLRHSYWHTGDTLRLQLYNPQSTTLTMFLRIDGMAENPSIADKKGRTLAMSQENLHTRRFTNRHALDTGWNTWDIPLQTVYKAIHLKHQKKNYAEKHADQNQRHQAVKPAMMPTKAKRPEDSRYNLDQSVLLKRLYLFFDWTPTTMSETQTVAQARTIPSVGIARICLINK